MPETKRPLKVFLCYAHVDRRRVHELYSNLRRRGITPWFDEKDLLGGQNWQVEIPKALVTSDAVIICLTKNSVDKEGYIQKEIMFALDKAKEMPEGRIFLIPIRFEECDVPSSLDRYQWVNLFEDDGYKRLMNALRNRAEDIGAALSEHKGREATISQPKVKGLKPQETAKDSLDRGSANKSRPDKDGFTQVVTELRDYSVKPPSHALSIFPLPTLSLKKIRLNINLLVGIGVIIVLFSLGLWKILQSPLAVMATTPGKSPTAVLTLTPFKPVPSVSPSKTVTPSITPAILTITPTLTSTPVPTPITSNILIMDNGSRQSCRVSPNGEIVDYIVSGTNALAFGRDENSDWLFVKNKNIEKYCWINIGGVKYQADEIAKLPLGMIYSKDAEMVLIPSGEFTMGDYIGTLVEACKHFDSASGHCDSQFFYDITVRDINLPSFYIDRYEVSNLQYKECVDAGICNPPTSSKSKTHDKYYGNVQYDKYPVVYVTWEMASAYCQKWRDGRLPSEAEWEKASRGADKRLFPWGNGFTGKEANFCDKYCDKSISYDDGYRDTAPVNSYFQGVSPYGIYNMSGNVWEWVMDQYANDYRMVFRGGAWNYPIYSLFSSNRGNNSVYYSENSIGFRCARDANP